MGCYIQSDESAFHKSTQMQRHSKINRQNVCVCASSFKVTHFFLSMLNQIVFQNFKALLKSFLRAFSLTRVITGNNSFKTSSKQAFLFLKVLLLSLMCKDGFLSPSNHDAREEVMCSKDMYEEMAKSALIQKHRKVHIHCFSINRINRKK